MRICECLWIFGNVCSCVRSGDWEEEADGSSVRPLLPERRSCKCHLPKEVPYQFFPSLSLGVRILFPRVNVWDCALRTARLQRIPSGTLVAAAKSMEWISAYTSRYGNGSTTSVTAMLTTEYVVVPYHVSLFADAKIYKKSFAGTGRFELSTPERGVPS